MKTEYVLPGYHHVDTLGELVHDNPLDQSLFDLESENKAASGHVVDLLSQPTLFAYRVNFDIFVHQEIFELVHSGDKDESLGHVGDEVEEAVLADAEYALGVGAVLGRVAVEKRHAHIDNVQLRGRVRV